MSGHEAAGNLYRSHRCHQLWPDIKQDMKYYNHGSIVSVDKGLLGPLTNLTGVNSSGQEKRKASWWDSFRALIISGDMRLLGTSTELTGATSPGLKKNKKSNIMSPWLFIISTVMRQLGFFYPDLTPLSPPRLNIISTKNESLWIHSQGSSAFVLKRATYVSVKLSSSAWRNLCLTF